MKRGGARKEINMHLSLYERETIITYNEAEKEANVYTHNKALLRKLEAWAKERPEECHMRRGDDMAADYIVPKKWVKVLPPRILTGEQKAKKLANLRKNHKINSTAELTGGTVD